LYRRFYLSFVSNGTAECGIFGKGGQEWKGKPIHFSRMESNSGKMGYDKDQGWSGKPPKDDGMTTVQITLPDQLAQEAERAGLLSSQSLENLLRRQLKAKAAEQLFAAMERMAAVDDPAFLSPEEIAEEISAMRAERRANGRG
jgi:hypothetical protein